MVFQADSRTAKYRLWANLDRPATLREVASGMKVQQSEHVGFYSTYEDCVKAAHEHAESHEQSYSYRVWEL